MKRVFVQLYPVQRAGRRCRGGMLTTAPQLGGHVPYIKWHSTKME